MDHRRHPAAAGRGNRHICRWSALLIGFGWAFALMLATTIAGFLVLRRAGRGRLARFRVAVAESDVAGIEANTGELSHRPGRHPVVPARIPDRSGRRLAADRPGPARCAAAFRRAVTGRERSGGRAR